MKEYKFDVWEIARRILKEQGASEDERIDEIFIEEGKFTVTTEKVKSRK